MSNLLQLSEFENRKHNDSYDLPYNQSMTLEFALFDKKIEKKVMSTGSLGLTVSFGVLV